MNAPNPENGPMPEYVIDAGWLLIDTGVHDCAGGTPEASGMHEPTCGLEPVMTVEALHALLASARREWGARLSERPDEVHRVEGEASARGIARQRRATGAGSAEVVVRDVFTSAWHSAPPDPNDPETWPFPPEPAGGPR